MRLRLCVSAARIPEGSPRTNAFSTAKRQDEKNAATKAAAAEAGAKSSGGSAGLLAAGRDDNAP